MRIAVLGAGSIGTRHRETVLALGHQVMMFDLVPRECVAPIAEWDPEGYRAVIVCTPWDQHLVYTQRAVTAGVAVYVEKPLGPLTERDVWQALSEEAAARGIVTQVGYQTRFHHIYRGLCQMCQEPARVAFRCAVDMETWPGSTYGPVTLEASHDIDLALATGARHGSVSVRNDSALAYLRDWRFELDEDSEVSATFTVPAALGTDMYRDAMRHFLGCVEAGRQTDIPLSDGVRVLDAVAQMQDGVYEW